MSPFVRWLRSYASSVLLCVTGMLFVAAAIWVVEDHQAVATGLVAFGSGQVILGALLPLVEGPVSVGPEGVTAVISRVARKGRERGLSDDQIAEAITRATQMIAGTGAARIRAPKLSGFGTLRPAAGPTADPVAEAIADVAIYEVVSKRPDEP